MTTSAEEIKALPTAHFVDWLERYAGSLRYGDPPTNGNDIAFLEVARRLSAMEAENKRLREALTFTREALFSALAGSNAAGDAETVDDVLDTLRWMADHLNPAHTLCVAVIDGRPPEPYFQKDIDAKRAEYAARAALEHQQKGEEL